ncbi:MAG: DUF5702 domain-containing protein [Pseudobutyrivibrio sp.]|nr:DUF5702 domain-containing protein [Pseudobutyrivibrio sp.]
MKKGSLSVFFSMILVAVLTLLMTMAECIRIYELNTLAQSYTDEAVESTFSEYNPYLWANYGILAIDLAYGKDNVGPGIMKTRALGFCGTNSNVEEGYSYIRMQPNACDIDEYTLLTDNSGQAVINLGSKYALEGLGAQLVDGIGGNIDIINNIESEDVEGIVNSGNETLTQAKNDQAQAKEDARNDDDPDTSPDDFEDPGEVEDNPLDAFGKMKESFSKGVLATVVEKEAGLSEETIDLTNAPSVRALNKGTMDMTAGNAVVDKVLFTDYLLSNYGYYGDEKGHDGLKYELEYLVGGNETDTQNLAAVIERILLIREAANYYTIFNSTKLRLESESMAAILAGFTGNKVIIDAVELALIGAWAYMESTLDVRLLISGGKVPAIKNPEQFTTNIWSLSSFANVSIKAKDCGSGLSYKDYLMSMIALKSNSELGLRCCDVMENALHATEDYANVSIDNMLCAANVSIGYTSEEMFLSIFGNSTNELGQYTIKRSKYLSY